MNHVPLLTATIRLEHDIVHARQRARQIAQLLQFDAQDQTRIATAVSELARNAYHYAKGGRVEFAFERNGEAMLTVRITDTGPGIQRIDDILNGRYVSPTGMGLGLAGAKRLMDRFDIMTGAAGTTIVLAKRLSAGAAPPSDQRIAAVAKQLLSEAPQNPLEELQQQNRELMRALDSLRERQEELANLNRELEDTNRGVVALYAELDEKADFLQRANEVKTRFLADMTHEFRTPLNSILSLSRLLLDCVDGPLNDEQARQVGLIRKSASSLSDLVNDLLDLAKVEAGKVTVKAAPFDVYDLFGALRGMLRPLLAHNASVRLLFDDPVDIDVIDTDEGKVSQILRNFISNALKYTEQGEVRVHAVRDGDNVVFSVADTGIGIAPEDQTRIFEEFIQVDSPLQKKIKGTGLGLPLARKLARLLGGDVWLSSEIGAGSTFYVSVPMRYVGNEAWRMEVEPLAQWVDDLLTVLVIEDDIGSLVFYQKCLAGAGMRMLAARDLRTARQFLTQNRPDIIVADILLEGEETWHFLAELKSNADTRSIPVMVSTIIAAERRARSLGAEAFHQKPVECAPLLADIERLTQQLETLVLVDDDATARYTLKRMLPSERYRVVEAENGALALRLAHEVKPAGILLDLLMPGVSGFALLQELRNHPSTARVPVVVHTSKPLDETEHEALRTLRAVYLSKSATADAGASTASLIEKSLNAARRVMQQQEAS